MAKIDTSEWKPFAIGSIFDVVKGTRLTKAHMVPGTTRFIGSSAMNNGCTAMVGNIKNMHPANTITVCYNGSVGETFYQDEPFLASDDVNVLYPKFDMSRDIALFIIPLIKAISKKYNYIDKWKQEVMISDEISLPVASSDELDWAYMGAYMSEVMREAERDLEVLQQANGDKHAVDVSRWQEFVIGDLFPNIVKPAVLHIHQVVETDEGIPYVVRTKFGNGIKYRVQPVDGMEPSPAGVITWGAENATFFYQSEPFLSGRDIYYVDTREYSSMACLFLVSCFQTLTHKYPYNFGLFPDLLREERIKLPVTQDGKPDWIHMDAYMSEIMQRAENSFDALTQAHTWEIAPG